MKKLIMLATLLITLSLSAVARDNVYHSGEVLPATAQQTLKKHFSTSKVNRVKVDKKTFGHTEYEVILDNGTEIEFNHKGEWKEIDCGRSGVPRALVPANILKYVESTHPGSTIIKLDKGSRDYEAELNDGTDLKFDSTGRFLRYD